jgi:hypothetical protein
VRHDLPTVDLRRPGARDLNTGRVSPGTLVERGGPGASLHEQPRQRTADPDLSAELDLLAGQTIDQL